VVVRDVTGEWAAYAIELNLRKGGTTHPFLTLQYLTDGSYHGDAGLFLTPAGQPKHLVATDHLESEVLKGLLIEDLFDIVATNGLHFDQATQTGVVFHMMSCLTECGRVGFTAVGGSTQDAWDLYDRTVAALLAEGAKAMDQGVVPV
jgi:PGM1 C-terminal domain